ncbi:MAG: 30S ribosomal protein S12 methylthiotransferase RimO [Planctomycetota bacterium]
MSLISLGCPKNLVDSEVLLGHAVGEGLVVARDPEDADIAVINTCGFIDSAKEESIQTILDVCELKKEGGLRGVVVVGCLSERYGNELRQELPEVDAVFGLSDYSRIPGILRKLALGEDGRGLCHEDAMGGRRKNESSDGQRLLLTPRSYAYLRIGEGCNHQCSFCAIPGIRGKMRSKPIEVLVEEARGLASSGVKELVLVAEDSTAYGMDWASTRKLPELLEGLAGVDGIEWIRVLYAYPHTVSRELSAQLRENPKVLPYLDIPIQHISSAMLRAMKRGVESAQVRRILDRLREEVPGIAIRTTYILGFPGERERDFQELYELTRDFRFERLGVFPYSSEDATPAAGLPDAVPGEIVEERVRRIMELSRQIIEERNRGLDGSELMVLVDGSVDPSESELPGEIRTVGRSYADAPEIDCRVLFREALPSGELVRARVTGTLGYDILAEPRSAAEHSGERR